MPDFVVGTLSPLQVESLTATELINLIKESGCDYWTLDDGIIKMMRWDV